MNENAKKWITALRSGNYDQDREFLRTKEGFCCLGVACDVYRKATGKGEWNNISPHGYYFEWGDSNEDTILPAPVMEWIGLCNDTGFFLAGRIGDSGSLSLFNDTGRSFGEIADVIESEPEGLFHE